ncbi:MAG: chromosome segregation protein SMC [Tissierellia bacterium]|nr:chromosome segregation protein SMC [Tissierellia bacterium]
MRLNKLEIHGFKSFAEKTILSFDKQVSVIVGPNGSGKSNISDAIRWVLGEQSAKSLRGSKMEDVIFTGTDNVKPMNYSKVSITFDNSEGLLPLDFKEVVVSRKVFRDGDSEYTINKSNCRLKDIRELFMDTGVGKEGYSIISQGRIDEILSSKPEDRRVIFDEASGVAKFKYKKEESQKKLNKTIENLVRIKDIINQLRDRHNFLEKESEKAKKGLKLIEELEIHQLSFFKRYLMDSEKELKASKNRLDSYYDSKREIDEDLNEISSRINPLKDDIDSSSIEVEDILREIENLNKKTTYLTADIKVLEEKKIIKNSESQRSDSEIKSERENLIKIESNLNNHEKDLKKFDGEIQKLQNKFCDARDDFSNHNDEIEELKANQSEIISKLDKLKEEYSEIKLKKNTNLSISNNYSIEIQNLNRQLEDASENRKSLEDQLISSGEYKKSLSDKNLELSSEFERLDKEIRAISLDLNKKLDTKNKLISQISQKKSNLRIIKGIRDNYEGFSKSVQNLLNLSKSNQDARSRIVGTLAELIKVESKYEKAVELSLASALQNVVTKNSEDAKYLIQLLKKNNMGRITFLPLDRFSGRDRLLFNLQRDDYLTVASDSIECDEEIRNLIEYLLGRTLIVEDMDSALKLSHKNNKNRIVTLDGDIVNAWGSMVGGSNRRFGPGLINRDSEIENLSKDIDDMQIHLNSINSNIDELIAKRNILESKYDDYMGKIDFTQKEIDELEKKLSEISFKFNMTVDLIEKLNFEIDEKSDQRDKLEDKDFENLEKLEDRISELSSSNEKMDMNKRKLYDQRMEKEKMLLSIENNIELLKRDKSIAENRKSDDIDNLKNTKNSIERLEKSILILVDEIKEIESDILKNKNIVKGYEFKLEDLNKNADKIKEDIAEKKLSYEQMSEKRIILMNDLSDIDKKISREENYQNTAFERIKSRKDLILEEYAISGEELDDKLESLQEIKTNSGIIKDLRNKIRDIGHFSYDSIEEYQIVKNDLDFYTGQKEDLIKSKEDIEKIIRQLDIKISNAFQISFNDINQRFNKIFAILFEGGSAKLVLKGDDILSSGVDIEVEPPGKKLQNLSLLSGGERALTAVALLFAIFETSPAPFCILDEVDAALDESNIGRYVNYLRSFEDIQFIVITHRKLTMEMADILYGVTMEQEGISKMYTLSLED